MCPIHCHPFHRNSSTSSDSIQHFYVRNLIPPLSLSLSLSLSQSSGIGKVSLLLFEIKGSRVLTVGRSMIVLWLVGWIGLAGQLLFIIISLGKEFR